MPCDSLTLRQKLNSAPRPSACTCSGTPGGIDLYSIILSGKATRNLIPKVEQQQVELNTLRSVTAPADSPVTAAVPALPSEPPEFMGQVNEIAGAANCRVNGFDLKPSAGSIDAGPVKAVHAQIMLIARYADIRNFVAQLARAPRVLVITELTLAPAPRTENDGLYAGALQATVEIERYVLTPGKK